MNDRVGIGWRPELAAGILANLDRVDVVEVIAEDFYGGRRRQRALRLLAAQVPVVLHGVGLGMASAAAADQKRIDQMARLASIVRPESWSEHLAFVRAGGIEIGHLAAAPRTGETVEGAAENLERARRTVGSRPLVENIATLVEPPGNTLTEWEWIRGILDHSRCDVLLDLHNLYANAVNHNYDPVAELRRIPAERIGGIHLGGGRWIPAPDGGRRLLDDHLHDVPDPVFELLEETAALVPQSLTVILERDGRFPDMLSLLGQMEQAKDAMARGRGRRAVPMAATA